MQESGEEAVPEEAGEGRCGTGGPAELTSDPQLGRTITTRSQTLSSKRRQDISRKRVQPTRTTKSGAPAAATPGTSKSGNSTAKVGKTKAKTASRKKKSQVSAQEHVLDEQVYLEIVGPIEPVEEVVQENVSFLSVDTSEEAACCPDEAPRAESTAAQCDPTYSCERCSKSFTTNHGLEKHLVGHRIEDANCMRPTMDTLYPHVEGFILESLQEIKNELFNEEKKCFVNGVLEELEKRPEDWYNFISKIAEPFLQSITVPSKVTFCAQYEEQLVALHKILSNHEIYNTLCDGLKFLNGNEHFSNSTTPGIVLYRLVSKFVDKLVHLVFNIMNPLHGVEETTPTSVSKSMIEEKAFSVHIRRILQEYIKKGLKQASKEWLCRCSCIRNNFVVTLGLEETASVEKILQNSSWEGMNSTLEIREEVISFFLKIENLIEDLIVKKSLHINCNTVTDIIFEPQHCNLLTLWGGWTEEFLPEVESLVFLRDLISILIKLSLRLEEGRIRSSLSSERSQKYALRSDLKRNK